MIDILALLQNLSPYLDKKTIKQLSLIIPAMIAMTGRVTMLGISRWTEKGGSYRTIQRFFYTEMPWSQLFWQFIRQHLLDPNAIYFLAGDESVVTKSGKKTYGLDYFFSSLASRPIPGLAFFALSLVNTNQRCSHPIMVEQVVRTAEEKKATKAKKSKKSKTSRKKPGRPKGSKNQNKEEVTLCPELIRIQKMVRQVMGYLEGIVPIKHLVMDGKFGNNNAIQMTQQCGLYLLSKMRYDAKLYIPYEGDYAGRGAPKKYGDRIDYDHIPNRYLQSTKTEKKIKTCIYQAQLWHTTCPQLLNVVIIHKTNLNNGKQAHVVLFTNDLELPWSQLIDFYRLRFQIEFNFRDAKQYWGFEDFMNIKATAVTNAANLSLFMVNVSQVLLPELRQHHPDVNVLDLKAHYRGHKYVTETLKLLPKKPEPILITRIFNTVLRLGRVHHPPCSH